MNTRMRARVCVFVLSQRSSVLSLPCLSPLGRLVRRFEAPAVGWRFTDRVVAVAVVAAMVAFIEAHVSIEPEDGLIEEVDQVPPAERCCSWLKRGALHFKSKVVRKMCYSIFGNTPLIFKREPKPDAIIGFIVGRYCGLCYCGLCLGNIYPSLCLGCG